MTARRLGAWVPRLAAGLLLAMVGCAEKSGAGTPPAHSTAGPQGAGAPPSGALTASASAPLPEPGWVLLVRMGRWADADAALAKLAPEESAKPEIRFVRARVAMERGEHARAVELLGGLESELPLLEREIRSRWAEAAAEAGPYREAADRFLKSPVARDLTRAAMALDRAGLADEAYKVASRAVAAAERGKSKTLQAPARGLRARIRVTQGKVIEALADLHWLAEHTPAHADGRYALTILEEHDKPLPGKRQLETITNLIAAGETKLAVESAEKLTGVSPAEKAHAKAWALYRARHYPDAIKAWEAAARLKSGRTAEQLYYLARSLARVGRDDDAIAKHDEVVKRFRTGLWAERAAFQKARLLLQNGKFEKAVKAYTELLSKFPKSSDVPEARYDLALAYLSSGEAPKAQKALSALAAKEKNAEVGRLRQLEGVAALRAGDKDKAIALWTEVAREQPLTWPAMMARARLRSVEAPLPPLIDPPTAGAMRMPLEIKLPPKVALLRSLGLDGDAEEVLSDIEQEAAKAYEGRESEALCGMYGMLSSARRRYQVGTAAVRYDVLMRAPAPGERWGWECVYPRPYEPIVTALEREHGLPGGLVHALMRQESAFKPEVDSPVGAAGLMQLMPTTASAAAVEASIDYDPSLIKSPQTNLALGAFYIAKLLRTFEGSIPLAVASYNAGPTAVSHWLAVGADHDADLWVARIPYVETRNYVGRVMGNLVRYQWLSGGDAAVTELSLELPVDARAGKDDY